MNTSIIFLLVYFIGIFVVTQLFSRQIHSLRDFFLAGRRLGSLPAALALTASWFGAASTLGSINAFHDEGLSGIWHLILPSILSFALITFFMAKPVARQSYLSQPEAVEAQYGKAGRLLLSLVILSATIAFIGSQMVAAAMVYKVIFGLSFSMSTIISAVAVLSYAMWGGYFAVVVTDIAQIIFVVAGFLILLVFTIGKAIPNPIAWQEFLVRQPPHFWDWSYHWQQNIFLVITFVLGWTIAPEMWQRMSSTRRPDLAFRAGWQASLIMVGLFSLIACIGLFSTRVIGHQDAVLIALALRIPSNILQAFVLLGFVAAVTSTMDSSINIGSLTLTRDIYQRFLHPEASERECIWVARITTLLMVLPAMAVALYFQDIIKILWISADIYACCMFWPIVGMLYLKQPGRLSGLLGMVFGGLIVFLNALIQIEILPLSQYWPAWPGSTLLGVGFSGVGYAIGYLFRRSRSDAQWPLPAET
jgi:SSS family solute:Na+ symporter